MALTGTAAQAAPPEPTPVPYTRSIDTNAGGAFQGWNPVNVPRLNQWKSDLSELERRSKQMQKVLEQLEKGVNQDSQVRDLLNFDHFFGYANRYISVTEGAMRRDFESGQDLLFEKYGLEKAQPLLKALKEDVQNLGDDALNQREAELTNPGEEKKQAKKNLENVREELGYRRRLMAKAGYPLNSSESEAYTLLRNTYIGLRIAYKDAVKKQATYEQERHILTRLKSVPVAEREKKLAELETTLQQKMTDFTQRLDKNPEALTDAFRDQMTQLFELDDKLSQIWRNPTGEMRVSFSKEDIQTFKNAMEGYLKMEAPHQAFVTDTIGRLNKESGLDLRLKTEEAPSPWPKNFMIGTASDQENVAYGDYYYQQLMAELPQAKSLSNAVQTMAQKALKLELRLNNVVQGTSWQYPQVSTQTVDSWAVGAKGVKRKVLIIAGGKISATDSIIPLDPGAIFKPGLKAHFGLKDEDFTILQQPTQEEVSAAFDALQKQGDGNTEVLILMQGHGTTGHFDSGLKAGQKYLQGTANGLFTAKTDKNYLTEVWLTEDFMKTQTHKLSGCKSGLMLLFSCHGGAWISKRPKTAEAPDNPFNPIDTAQRNPFLSTRKCG